MTIRELKELITKLEKDGEVNADSEIFVLDENSPSK